MGVNYNFPKWNELPAIHELPNPFIKADGSMISSVEEWPEQRDYLKEMMAHYLYGHMPEGAPKATGKVVFASYAYEGKAIRETVEITAGRNSEVKFLAHVLRPFCDNRVPTIVYNNSIQPPEQLEMSEALGMNLGDKNTYGWGTPIDEELVCERGYALVQYDREQLAADSGDGVRGMAAKAFPECDWGVIAIWAWGMICINDYLETTKWADMEKLISTGYSRGGKTALCAGIYDERFAVVAPGGSGCGGAGCFRYLGSRLGEDTGICETAGSINDLIGYFWTDNFADFGYRFEQFKGSNFPVGYNQIERFATYFTTEPTKSAIGKTKNEDNLPFDMHTAKALVAPRALISIDMLADAWANPFGTHVTWRAAQEVFEFLGVPENNALHFRDGIHDSMHVIDWKVLLDYSDKVFAGKNKNPEINYVAKQTQEKNLLDYVEDMKDWKTIKLHYSWRNPLA